MPCTGAGPHLATSGQREPRGSLCATAGNRGLGRAAHTRGVEAGSEHAPPVLNGPSVPTAQSVAVGRARPWTAAPLCRLAPSSCPGPGRLWTQTQLLCGQLPRLPGTSLGRPRPVPSVWRPGFHPGAGLGGQGRAPAAAGGRAERRPAPEPAPSPGRPTAVPGSA